MSLSQEEWEGSFPTIVSPSGETIWEHSDTLAVPPERVWTIISTCEDDGLYAVAGYRRVNRVGYVVTEKPWPDLDCQGVWDEPSQQEHTGSERSTLPPTKREKRNDDMSIQAKLERIAQDLSNASGDAEKADSGNASAGVRVRKSAMQAMKDLKDLRKDVTDLKK